MNNNYQNKDLVKIAVFDFDGTLIPDQSGQKLALHMAKTGQFSWFTIIRLVFWGLRYKAHLPYRQNLPRELIFRAFAGKKAKMVDEYIDMFYEKNLDNTVRKKLLDKAKQIQNDGVDLIVLSAAFVPTLQSFAKRHGFKHVIGTRMQIDNNGCYTGKVDGNCVAGKDKINYLKAYADKKFGNNNWKPIYAFADHYTDIYLLENFEKVYIVNPDRHLKKEKEQRTNWEILHY